MALPTKPQNVTDDRGIEYAVFVDDVQKLAESIKTAAADGGSDDDSGRKMSWDVYHPLEDMYEYMDYLEGTFSKREWNYLA